MYNEHNLETSQSEKAQINLQKIKKKKVFKYDFIYFEFKKTISSSISF